MTKSELAAFAADHNIEGVSTSMLKAEMITAIKEALSI